MKTFLGFFGGIFASTLLYANTCMPDRATKQASSDWWQVRYTSILQFNSRNEDDKRQLEKLIGDKNDKIVGQALGHYLNQFTNINRELVRSKLDRMNSPLHDPLRSETAKASYANLDLKSVESHMKFLSSQKEAALNGSLIQRIGILGNLQDAKRLNDYAQSTNPYVLCELAKAYVRMGNPKSGIQIAEKIPSLVKLENFYYQIEALYIIFELDKERAISLFKARDENLRKIADLTPDIAGLHFQQGVNFGVF